MKKKMILWSVAIAMCGGILGIWLIDGTAPFKEALQKIRGQRSQSMMEEIPWEEGQVGTAGMIRQLERIDIATTIPNCRFQSCAIVDELLRMPLPKDWKERYAYESDLLSELTNCGRLKEAAERIKMLENTGIFTKLDDLYLSKWYSANGIHYLRNGEVVNCVTNHNETSCIFPLVDKAFHTDKTGASKAIEMYTKALNLNPDDLSSRWLINIAFMQLGVYPEAVPEKWLIEFTPKYPEAEIAPFRNIAAEVGVDFGDMCGAVILDDFNGDGLIDIFQAGWGLDETVHYMENAGDGTFKDQTKSAGLEHYPGGLMMQQTDYNNDGYLDIFILRGAWYGAYGIIPNSLLKNNGDGTFTDVTRDAGLYSCHPTQTATWADFNNDGWIDVFIGNEASRKIEDERFDSELYLNDKGVFRNVAKEANANINGFVKGVSSGDYDNDGDADIYVSINGKENVLLKNITEQGSMQLRFANASKEAGVAAPIKSFPCMFLDINNDGWLDILSLSYDAISSDEDIPAEYLGLPRKENPSAVYINQQDGTFQDEVMQYKLDQTLLVMGANFGDYDMDGWLDLYVGTGKPSLRAIIPNRLFHNNQGEFFTEVTTSSRMGHLQKGHGVSFADLNNDGYPEIYAQMGGSYEADGFQDALYENPASWGNNWVSFDLKGTTSNASAIGARIELIVSENGKERHIYDWVTPGSSFGASSLRMEIGIGQADAIQELRITWPGAKKVQVISGLEMRKHYKIVQGSQQISEWIFQAFTFPATFEMSGHHMH